MTDRYRRRPAEIEAAQWADTNPDELTAFAGHRFMTIDPEDRTDDPDATASLIESAHESWALLRPGDWVVKRGDDFAVLSPEEFGDLYEPAVPAPATDQATLRDRIADALAAVLAECDAIEADYRDQHDEVAVGTRAAVIRIRARVAVLEQQPAVLPAPADRATVPAAFVVWLDASDGSVPTHDGVLWPDGRATLHHRHFGYTTTHADPEAARQAAHGKQGRLVWPEPADQATVPPAVGVFATLVRQRADHLEAALARMRDRLEVTRIRVQRLHTPGENGECQHCHHGSPCPTVQALDDPVSDELLRMADETQQPEVPAVPPVGYSGKGRVWCLSCPRPVDEDVPVTVDVVNDWDLCPSCGRHVVDVARAAAVQQPREARP